MEWKCPKSRKGVKISVFVWVLLTGLRGALGSQLRFGLAVADGGDVLAALHGRVPPRGVGARRLLHVLHLHLLVVDPQIRGPQVLLAALPLAGAVGRTFPAAKENEKGHVKDVFPLCEATRIGPE